MRSKFFKISLLIFGGTALLLLVYLAFTGGKTGYEAKHPILPDERVIKRSTIKGLPIEDVYVDGVKLKPFARKEWIAKRVENNKARILLLGMDGADWDIIMPLIKKGELKNFQRLLETGVHGYLKSMQPTLSPLLWTTIATGKLPEKHGILDFIVTDTVREKKIPVTSNLRRVKALWNILTDYNQDVGFVGWLASWPAEKVNGFNVSDRLGYHTFAYIDQLDYVNEGLVYPESLMEIAKKYSRGPEDVSYSEIRRFVKIDRKEYDESFQSTYDRFNPINNLRLILATSETYSKLGYELLRKYRPKLFGIYFEAIDAAGHLFMRYMPPLMDGVSKADYSKYKGAIEEVYKHQDMILGRFLKEAGENSVVIIVSDHGFKTGKTRPGTRSEIGMGAAASWHDLYGIIIVAGKGAKKGEEIYGASVLDITPTVLAVLGFPVARDMDGKVLKEAFTDDYWRDNPVITINSYDEGWKREKAEGPEISAMDDKLMEKLRALGYIDGSAGGEKRDARVSAPAGVIRGASRHRNLGIALIEKGDLEGAIVELRKALDLEPMDKGIHNDIGIALVKLGRNSEALSEFETALRYDPGNASIVGNIGRSLQYMGRIDESVGYFKRAIEMEPTMAIAHRNLGNAYLQQGRLDLAKKEYLITLDLEPNSPEASHNLGFVYMQEGETTRAEEAFKNALKSRPDFVEAHKNLALLYQKQRRIEDAIRHWKAVLKIDPSSQEARKSLKMLNDLHYY